MIRANCAGALWCPATPFVEIQDHFVVRNWLIPVSNECDVFSISSRFLIATKKLFQNGRGHALKRGCFQKQLPA
jgi:hypothetical protein